MTDYVKTHRDIGLAIVAASCAFAYALVFRLPGTPFLIEADHHIFLYEGMRMFQGDRIYADFFEFTFPGTQTFYWFAFSAFGLRYWILGATIVAIAGASAWTCVAVSKRVIGGALYLLPALGLIFFGFRWLGTDASHRTFSPIFAMAAVAALLAGRRGINSALAGGLCALAAFFTQQRGVVALAAIVIFVLLDAVLSKESWRTTIRPIVIVVCTFVVTLTLLCSYFVIEAGPANFFYATIIYPVKYYGSSYHNNLATLPYDLGNIFRINTATNALAVIPYLFYLFGLPVAYVVFWIAFIAKGRKAWSEWRGVGLVAILGTLLTMASLGAPNSGRMFQISMPGLIVLVWLAARYMRQPWHRPLTAAVAAVLLLVGLVQVYRIQSWDYSSMETPSGRLAYLPSSVITERYNFLLERTRPGDTVYEVYEPFIYFPLHLRNPTPYGQIWPSNYSRPEQVAEVVTRLEVTRPRYIIWDNLYSKPDTERAAGDHTGPLAKYVADHYHPANNEVDIGEAKIQIWERKD